MLSKEIIARTNPSLNPSYSPNLHKFIKKWARGNPDYWTPEVWKDDLGELWIGRMDPSVVSDAKQGFIGLRMTPVLCNGARAERFWWPDKGPANMTKVEDFWSRYFLHGRCAIDEAHTRFFIGDDSRYSLHGNQRTCHWCGAKHTRRTEQVISTREVEHFDPTPV